ncbi:peroxidase 5-like [Fagus crenata]
MRSRKLTCVSITLIVVLLCQNVHSQLQVGFYRNSCDCAESIVKDEVRNSFIKDQGVAAGLVRLHFHDCFVRGCDASVLIDSTSPSNQAEKDAPANNPSLRGFEVIDNAKARLEAICKGVVSCADILAFAARDSVEISGGIGYDVPAGRRDGKISLASDTFTNLPPPFFNVDQLTQLFANKGFTQEEMVTLSGAHTIGRSHCTPFSNRLYNFSATTSQDPSLDPMYASQLKQQCPQGSTNPNLVVPMDPSSLGTIDAGYYTNILANQGLFTSDQTLLTNAATVIQVNQNARNAKLWRSKFASAMLKMGQLDVLTGNAGEIRSNCREIVKVYQDTIYGQNPFYYQDPFYDQGPSPILSVQIKYITYIVSLITLVNVWIVYG